MCDTIPSTFRYHGTEVRSIEHGLAMLDHGPFRQSVNLEGDLIATRNRFHGVWVRSQINPSDLDLAVAAHERIESANTPRFGELHVFYFGERQPTDCECSGDHTDSWFFDLKETTSVDWFKDASWPCEWSFSDMAEFDTWRQGFNLEDFTEVRWAIFTV